MSLSPELSEIIDFLRAHAPFDCLAPEQLAQTARKIDIVYRRKGEVMLRIGETNVALAVIRRGAVEVHDKDERLVNRLAEGDSYGLPSLLTGKPVRHRVTLLEDGLIYLLPVADFHALRASNTGFDQYFVSTLEERLRHAAENAGGGQSNNEMMTTPVGKLSQRAPVMIAPQASIREAAKLMSKQGVSSLLVGGSEQMLGIVTDRDLRNRVLAADLDPVAPVTAIMTAEPASIDVERPVFEAFIIMANRGIHHLPLTRDGIASSAASSNPLGTTTRTRPVSPETPDTQKSA